MCFLLFKKLYGASLTKVCCLKKTPFRSGYCDLRQQSTWFEELHYIYTITRLNIFQYTENPHIQTNIWILNPPILYNINDHKLSIPCWHIYTMFRKPKDKLDRDHTTHIVYKIKCRDCTAVYIGQTTRSLKTRIKNIVARHRYLG